MKYAEKDGKSNVGSPARYALRQCRDFKNGKTTRKL